MSWTSSPFSFQPGKHIIGLDGLRGLAILMVLVFHFTRTFTPIFRMGWAGVDLFFVLSGFLITGILIDTRQSNRYFKNFISRRVLRIFPLYYFALLCFFLAAWIFKSDYFQNQLGAAYFLQHGAWYLGYSVNWLIIKENHWLPVEVFNHFWSLAIEEQFYLVWPLVVWLAGHKMLARICVFLIIGSLALRLYWFSAGSSMIEPYVSTFGRLDALAMGALLATLVRAEKNTSLLKKAALPVLAICALSVLILVFSIHSMDNLHPLIATIGFALNVYGFGALLVLTISGHPKIKILMENPIMIFFGKYSYSLYIFHVPVHFALTQWMGQSKSTSHHILLALASFIISILLALMSMKVIEMPFLRLKRFFV